MASNVLKTPPVESAQSESAASTSLFQWLEGSIKLDTVFKDGIPARYLPKIAFCFFLCLVYIGLSHQSARTIHKLNKAKLLLEDLRVNYITQKAELMYQSKQSEVAKQVEPLDLLESETPPKRIEELK